MTTTKNLKLKDRVRHYRLERKWSQAEFAKRCGISLRTVKRLEAGEPVSEQTEFDAQRMIEREAVA